LAKLDTDDSAAFKVAFTNFWNAVQPLITKIVGKLAKNEDLGGVGAEDLCQQVALTLFDEQKLRTFNTTVPNAVPWIAAIATNLVRDTLRAYRTQPRPLAEGAHETPDLDALCCPKTHQPDQQAIYHELCRLTQATLWQWAASGTKDYKDGDTRPAGAGDDFRTFIARHFDTTSELPTGPEIAEHCPSSLPTAKSRRLQARAVLKKKLPPECK
jgi:DNA-directed RNA polymerase specialized sigma24 family protein